MQADDTTRELTDIGRLEVKKMAEWIAAHYPPDAMLVSPYVRARQTADGVKAVCGTPAFDEICSDITPNADPTLAADYLAALIDMHPEYENWLVVAHMPIVSYLVDQFCPEQMPLFHTAGVAVLDYDTESRVADLISLTTP